MTKKIFISYSWGNQNHNEWVVDLATRLMHDSIDVVLDRWSLKDGHDIYSFMEEMVKSEEIFRVLILSDKNYKEKADSREGGVGTETQIITPNLYSKEKQEKFVPIVLQRDENFEPYLPIYLKTRKYIDFSEIEKFEESYEELLRNILEAPSLPKPKLGSQPPTYITESKINFSETSTRLKTLEFQNSKGKGLNLKDLTSFIETFAENLWEFEQKNPPTTIKEYGENLLNDLVSFKPLKEDYIKFIDIVSINNIKNSEDILIEFFENSIIFKSPKDKSIGTYRSLSFEIFKIIFHELFIYTIAVCLKNKNYKLIADLLNSKYYIKDSYRSDKPENFTFIYEYHRNLEDYSSQYFSRVTGFGHYLITNISNSIEKDHIITADTLCYFSSYLNRKESRRKWFPLTYIYNDGYDLTFFKKASSKKHFEKTKEIFNVETKEELKEKLNESKSESEDRIRYGKGFHEIPFIHELIEPDNIGIYR